MKKKNVDGAKPAATKKTVDENPAADMLNIIIGIAAVSIMALIIVWMLNSLL